MVGCQDICCNRDSVIDFFNSLPIRGNPIRPTIEDRDSLINYVELSGKDPAYGLIWWALNCELNVHNCLQNSYLRQQA
jgi:hypothetical protein